MRNKHYIYKFLISFISVMFLIGCGTENKDFSQKNQTIIAPNRPSDEMDNTQVENALRKIKQNVADLSKVYISKDKKDIFVVTGSLIDHCSLIDYDITGEEPQIRDMIEVLNGSCIATVIPLDEGKILYQYDLMVETGTIILYDYLLQNRIGLYTLGSRYHNALVSIDKSEEFFSLPVWGENYQSYQKRTVYIGDHFENNQNVSSNFYRDDVVNVVVDTKNRLVWKDNYLNAIEVHNYEEAQKRCQELPQNSEYSSWRLPTAKELTTIIANQNKFEYMPSSTYGRKFWVYASEQNLSHIYGVYDDMQNFDWSKEVFVRCVADLN